MPQALIPTWENLKEVIFSAKDRVLICSPYYSTSGIHTVFDNFGKADHFQFWTRFNRSEWVSDVIDPESLLALIDTLNSDHRQTEVLVGPRLHAKAFIADRSLALIGSANLSDGGFGGNIELMVRFENQEAIPIIEVVESLSSKLRPFNVEELRTWINKWKPLIQKVKSESNDEAEQLSPVQRDLDTLLGYGKKDLLKKDNKEFQEGEFVGWLEQHQEYPGAKVLVDRHSNADGNNLTGHFRQCFYGSIGFLHDNPDLQAQIYQEFANLEPGNIFQPKGEILQNWIDYFDSHATLSGDNYDYSILRGYLPTALGGTRVGGGGGNSTFKRMIPLVAVYLKDKGKS